MRPSETEIKDVCRLCADCQRSCKQQACVTVVNCPHYVRVPRQGQLFESGVRKGPRGGGERK